MRMLRRTEFYPWPNGPCYRALCSLGLGGFPPAGARADQAGGASQVSARSEHARSLRRPGTLSYAIGPWSPGTGILVSDNFQSCRVERKEPHDLEAPSWARTGSTHHPCGGGLRRLRMFPAHERRVMEASSDVAHGRHAPATLARTRGCGRGCCKQRSYWYSWVTAGG